MIWLEDKATRLARYWVIRHADEIEITVHRKFLPEFDLKSDTCIEENEN